jgi:hypothetical protein
VQELRDAMLIGFTQTSARFCEGRRQQGRSSSPVSSVPGQCLYLGDGPGRAGLPASGAPASPPPGLGGVEGAREAGARSDPKRTCGALWGIPALHLACPAADGRDPKKKRGGTPSAAPGKERRICACVSAMSAAAKSLFTLMKAALPRR